MGEVRFAVLPDVDLQIMPEALLVANLAAGSADRQQAAQALYACQSMLHFGDQPVAFCFGRLALSDIAHDDAGAGFARGISENNRRDFYWEQRAVGASGEEFSMSPAGRFSLFDQGRQSRIGRIHKSVSSCPKNLLAGTTQDPARGRIRVENSAIGRSEQNAVEAMLEQHGVKSFVVPL